MQLAPVFWHLVPILAVALALALFLKEIPMSDVAGTVARGEAVGSEEELARLVAATDVIDAPVVLETDDLDDDDRGVPVPA